MVLIPKRDEFNDEERGRLWWDRDDYSRFRQVLIDWKRRNAHRISQTDNILSIDLGEIDEEDDRLHSEALAAADATAAAAKAAAAAHAAKAAAEATAARARAAEAAAMAAAAAAATAAEVAAANEWETALRGAMARKAAGSDPIKQQREAVVAEVSPGDSELLLAGTDRYGRAASVGGPVAPATTNNGGNTLSEIPEEQQASKSKTNNGHLNGNGKPVGGRAFKSFNAGSQRPGYPQADLLSDAGDGRVFPLRRTSSINGEDGKRSFGTPAAARLKEVPLSAKQATVESLRAWRNGLEARVAAAEGRKELRGRQRSSSLQDKTEELRGRAVLAPSKPASQRSSPQGSQTGGAGSEADVAQTEADSVGGVRDGTAELSSQQTGEKLLRTCRRSFPTKSAASDPAAPPPVMKLSSPLMTAFERQRREAKTRQEAEEAAEVAKAAAMVEKAAAAHAAIMMEEASLARIRTGASPLSAEEIAEAAMEALAESHGQCGVAPRARGDSDDCKHEAVVSGQVVQLGLNDNPESAALAAATGIRMAAEGVSNLSLRSRDSLDNLQELAERAWGSVPLSSSA